MAEGDSKYTPLVLAMGVNVYRNHENKWVVDSKDLKHKVETMLRRKGLIE